MDKSDILYFKQLLQNIIKNILFSWKMSLVEICGMIINKDFGQCIKIMIQNLVWQNH